MAKGGSGTTTQYVKSEQSNLPEYARPYFESMMQRSQSLLSQPYQRYVNADGTPIERIAGFTPEQQQVQQNVLNQQTPGQFGTATGLGTAAGLGSLTAGQYGPGQFESQQIGLPNLQQYQMQGARNVRPMMQGTPQMGTAQTGYAPNLDYFQMGPTERVSGIGVSAPEMQSAQTGYQPNLNYFQMRGPQSFTRPDTAAQYMSPFIQQALEPQMREAITSARRGQVAQDLGAARQGTYGGSRQLLASMERERNLGQQLGDIQSRGLQSAFEQAQGQFNAEQAAQQAAQQANLQARLGVQQLGAQTGTQIALANLSNEQQARVNNQALQFQAQGMSADNAMKAALANQQAGLTAGQTNLQAALGVQQLGTQTGTQLALANLDAASQANVQNLAAQLQTQGLNADQALRAALANQQAQLTTGQQNLQAALETQRLGATTGLQALQSNQQSALEAQRLAEQSRQFGANLGLQGLGQAGQIAQTLGNLGQMQGQTDLARLSQQQQTAAQQQALQQQYLDTAYQDFLRQRDYPLEQLQQYSSLLRGVPVTPSTTTTAYAPTPGIGSQIMGTGLAALGAYKSLAG